MSRAASANHAAPQALALPPIETASLSAIAIDEMFRLEYDASFVQEFYAHDTAERQTLGLRFSQPSPWSAPPAANPIQHGSQG